MRRTGCSTRWCARRRRARAGSGSVLGRGARSRGEELARVRDEPGGEAILPYSYAGTQGLIQGNTMSARVMHALGATSLERTICATAGIVGGATTHGVSPEVDPDEWHHARHLLVWGWNPMSTAPHLWRKLLEARRAGARLVVVDPFRSRTARVADEHLRPIPGTDAALAIGMMRAVWTPACRTRTGAAPTPTATTSCSGAGRPPGRALRRDLRVDADTIARNGREFATTRPALLSLGVGAQRHLGAPAAYSTIASLPALTGAWRDRGGGCSYIPIATAAAVSSHPLEGEDLLPGPCAPEHGPARHRAHRRGARPADQGARLLELESGVDRSGSGARARGAAARGPVHRRAGAVHDRHGDPRRRGASRNHSARAHGRGLLLGPSLPDLERAGGRAAGGGQAEHRGIPAARRAPGAGPTRASARATRR